MPPFHPLLGSSSHRIILVILLLSSFAVSQIPNDSDIRDVDVCDLLKSPNAFDKSVVRFRGRLIFEFEGDQVDDSTCHLPSLHTAIWWDYGKVPAASQDNDQDRSLTWPILADASLDQFKKETSASRARRPDGQQCASDRECRFYDVLATFTGRFFAKRKEIAVLFSGFGHMGCCHLFVIEQISDVDAKRTSVPTDALSFTCTTTSWQDAYPQYPGTNIDERLERNLRFLTAQMRTHGDE